MTDGEGLLASTLLTICKLATQDFRICTQKQRKLTSASSLWLQASRTAGDEARLDIWFFIGQDQSTFLLENLPIRTHAHPNRIEDPGPFSLF
jgi:hypothetical protein